MITKTSKHLHLPVIDLINHPLYSVCKPTSKDFTERIRSNLQRQIKNEAERWPFPTKALQSLTLEQIVLKSIYTDKNPKEIRDIVEKNECYRPGSHDQKGDFFCSDGTFGCRGNECNHPYDTIKISMYRTTEQKSLVEKVEHVSSLIKGMKGDIWVIRYLDKNKNLVGMKVSLLDPSKIKEIDPLNYTFKTEITRNGNKKYTSNKINECSFTISESMSGQFWFHCSNQRQFFAKDGILILCDIEL